MLNLFKNLSIKKLILISIGVFVLMGVVVVLYFFKLFNETAFIIIMFILLMIFSTFTSQIWQRHFQKKLDEKKKGKTYKFKGDLNFKNPLKRIKADYGIVEVYLENKTLYTLIKVNDSELFFSEDSKQVKYNVDRKKYDKLIQFYLFDVKDTYLFRKISILNYQSNSFYVGSFIFNKEEKTIFQTDNVKPNDEYQVYYDNFLNLINIDKDQE